MKIPLKELRRIKGVTQADLSKALNISPSTVGMWEQGRREPDFENLKQIADYFNVSTDYLLGRSKDGSCSLLSSEQEDLINAYGKLNKKNQKIIAHTMKAFLTEQAASVFGSVINNNNGNGNFFANNGNVYAT